MAIKNLYSRVCSYCFAYFCETECTHSSHAPSDITARSEVFMDFDDKVNRVWKHSNVFIMPATCLAPSDPLPVEFHIKPTKAKIHNTMPQFCVQFYVNVCTIRWLCTVMYTQLGYLFVFCAGLLGNDPDGPKYVRDIMRTVDPFQTKSTYSKQYYAAILTQLCCYLKAACFGVDIDHPQAEKHTFMKLQVRKAIYSHASLNDGDRF